MENNEPKGMEKGCCHGMGMSCGQGGCSCKVGGCHGRVMFGAIRVIVALVILVGVFCAGFAAGSMVSYLHGERGGYSSRMMGSRSFGGGMMDARYYQYTVPAGVGTLSASSTTR